MGGRIQFTAAPVSVRREGNTEKPTDTEGPKGEPAAPLVEMLELKKIRTDGGTQLRAKLSEKVIEEYAAAMREGHRAEFPPLMVFFDGTDYWLADGHHRYHAAQRVIHGVRYETFDCEIH